MPCIVLIKTFLNEDKQYFCTSAYQRVAVRKYFRVKVKVNGNISVQLLGYMSETFGYTSETISY